MPFTVDFKGLGNTHNPRGIWAITQNGIEQEQELSGRGLSGRILTALQDMGPSTTDKVALEARLDINTTKRALQVLKQNGCVQCQS